VSKLLVLGAGLMGASIGLAAREAGWETRIADVDSEKTSEASAVTGLLGLSQGFDPDVVVVGTPPSSAALTISKALQLYPKSIVIDIASIKNELISDVYTVVGQNAQYVPTHPMAGRAVSGALNARFDLFLDRRWVICPQPANTPEVLEKVEQLVRDCGALPIYMAADVHDRSVSSTSHLPQIVSSLLAKQLERLTDDQIAVSGPGLRDMTRLAESNSSLWTDIVLSNNRHIYDSLLAFIDEATTLASAIKDSESETIDRLLKAGNVQRERIPGKHGEVAQPYVTLSVMLDDKPGQLAGIFDCAGKAEINIEDVRIDHALGRNTAIVELSIKPQSVKALESALVDAGWNVRDSDIAR